MKMDHTLNTAPAAPADPTTATHKHDDAGLLDILKRKENKDLEAMQDFVKRVYGKPLMEKAAASDLAINGKGDNYTVQNLASASLLTSAVVLRVTGAMREKE